MLVGLRVLRARPLGIIVVGHRDGIYAAQPPVEIDVAAAARAERPELFQRWLAAERAWLVGGEWRTIHGQKIGRDAGDENWRFQSVFERSGHRFA